MDKVTAKRTLRKTYGFSEYQASEALNLAVVNGTCTMAGLTITYARGDWTISHNA